MLNPNYFFLFTVPTKAKQIIQKKNPKTKQKKNLRKKKMTKPSTENLKVLVDCD